MTNQADQTQHSLLAKLVQLPSYLAAVTLFLLMAMTFFDVLLRSLANNPIESATELTRLFMAIIVFSSLPMVTWKGQHIVVDLMDPLFSATLGKLRNILINTICGVVLLWPAWRVYELAERSRSYGDITEYLHMPQFYIGWFIALATFVTALIMILRGLLLIIAPHKVPAI
ncbi:MAG: TRAP transporter small permease [Rhodobacteraceae bacterium]|nr:TRAP transporter small permease [Paracoccaceae bacterium]